MLLRKELFDLKPFNDGYVLEKIDEYSKIKDIKFRNKILKLLKQIDSIKDL
jgi:hypothetical protein